jgi:hypothetical protein
MNVQRDPSPAGALDGGQGVAGAGQHADDRPDPDQRADGEQQVGPADAFGLRELGHLDSGPAGHAFPQPGQQALVILERGHGAWVQRRALQVDQGAAGGVGMEDPDGRRGRAFGARADGQRGQRGG